MQKNENPLDWWAQIWLKRFPKHINNLYTVYSMLAFHIKINITIRCSRFVVAIRQALTSCQAIWALWFQFDVYSCFAHARFRHANNKLHIVPALCLSVPFDIIGYFVYATLVRRNWARALKLYVTVCTIYPLF